MVGKSIATVHLGVAAFQMEKRGIRTERGNLNREIEITNREIRQLRARINKLKSGLGELLNPAHPIPSIGLADVLTGILEKPEEKTRRKKITDLKTFAKAIAFLQVNDIANLAGLRDKVVDMYNQLGDVSDSLKKIVRRQKTLAEHIRQADFYERNRTGLALYEAAAQYLEDVMNGHTTIPTGKWKKEVMQLASTV